MGLQALRAKHDAASPAFKAAQAATLLVAQRLDAAIAALNGGRWAGAWVAAAGAGPACPAVLAPWLKRGRAGGASSASASE